MLCTEKMSDTESVTDDDQSLRDFLLDAYALLSEELLLPETLFVARTEVTQCVYHVITPYDTICFEHTECIAIGAIKNMLHDKFSETLKISLCQAKFPYQVYKDDSYVENLQRPSETSHSVYEVLWVNAPQPDEQPFLYEKQPCYNSFSREQSEEDEDYLQYKVSDDLSMDFFCIFTCFSALLHLVPDLDIRKVFAKVSTLKRETDFPAVLTSSGENPFLNVEKKELPENVKQFLLSVDRGDHPIQTFCDYWTQFLKVSLREATMTPDDILEFTDKNGFVRTQFQSFEINDQIMMCDDKLFKIYVEKNGLGEYLNKPSDSDDEDDELVPVDVTSSNIRPAFVDAASGSNSGSDSDLFSYRPTPSPPDVGGDDDFQPSSVIDLTHSSPDVGGYNDFQPSSVVGLTQSSPDVGRSDEPYEFSATENITVFFARQTDKHVIDFFEDPIPSLIAFRNELKRRKRRESSRTSPSSDVSGDEESPPFIDLEKQTMFQWLEQSFAKDLNNPVSKRKDRGSPVSPPIEQRTKQSRPNEYDALSSGLSEEPAVEFDPNDNLYKFITTERELTDSDSEEVPTVGPEDIFNLVDELIESFERAQHFCQTHEDSLRKSQSLFRGDEYETSEVVKQSLRDFFT